MAVTKSKSKFKDGEVVQCIQSFATETEAVATGERRVVDDLVRMSEKLWVRDGATTAEIGAATAALLEFEDSPPSPAPAAPAERRLADADAAVSVASGERIAKRAKVVKENPDAFAPVLPEGLRRDDAVLVRQTLAEVDGKGEVVRVAHRGTLIHKDDPFVALHPLQVELPALEKEAS
jgi:hypothetical protein